jgi:hypothetical protein
VKKTIPAALTAVLALLPLFVAIPTYTTNTYPSGNVVAAAYPSTITFSGYTWYVENNERPCNPGPNYWSNNPQNVWVDANGWLHLAITNRQGKWYCAELTSTQTFGYGTYVFYLASRIDNLDKNVVFGLFAYKDDSHEVDIEFSKWGNINYKNAWYTVQPSPYVDGRNQKAFNVQLTGDYTTHFFTWSKKSVFFESFHGHYPIGTQPASNIIQSFTSASHPSASGVKAHINLWLYQGNPPSNGLPVEVVVKSFQFIS